MKYNVLVFPCGSEIGLEIDKALKYCQYVNLFGGSSINSNHGRFVYSNYIEGIPFVDNDNFIPALNEIVVKYKIDFIFPAHDSVLKKLAENNEQLKCSVIASPKKTCSICRSKKETYEFFKDKIKVPELLGTNIPDCSYPVFVKPDVGQGSKGAVKVNSKAELEFYLKMDPTLIVLEYLPGEEYTIDCFTDRHGKLRFAKARIRERISNGITVHSYNVENDDFIKMANIINNSLLFRGAWFFQVKEDINGELSLLEIAPRIAGTMGMYRNTGINFPLLSIYDYAETDIDIIDNNFNIEVDRALISRYKLDINYEHVYVDFDDCLIINGHLNKLLIAFLYQCVNGKKTINLLTRHRQNIYDTLKHYRLESLFDTVQNVGPNEMKSQFIKNRSAIFIDDSFKERKEVREKLGVPVFSPDAVESLLF